MATKLDQLEMGAALLERDARNGRSPATLALVIPEPRTERPAARAWPQTLRSGYGAVRGSVVWLNRAARSPRLHAAVRSIWAWLIEDALVLSATCLALLGLVLAILLLAPPD